MSPVFGNNNTFIAMFICSQKSMKFPLHRSSYFLVQMHGNKHGNSQLGSRLCFVTQRIWELEKLIRMSVSPFPQV